MNEFKEMIKEAFLGEEVFDASPGRAALEASVEKYDRRERVARFMAWFTVSFMSIVFLWAAWSFWQAGSEASTKQLILYASVALWGMIGIGSGKLFLLHMQTHISLMKELKRMQLTFFEQRQS